MRKFSKWLAGTLALPMMLAPAYGAGTVKEAHLFFTNNIANSNTFTLEGETRTFVTNTISDAAHQVAITNTIGFQKTNFFAQVAAHAFTNGVDIIYGLASNEVVLISLPNQSLTASLAGSWGYLTFKTNQYFAGTTVRADTNLLGRAQATNQGSTIVALLPSATNRIPTGITAMGNYGDLTTTQTLSNKTFRTSALEGGTIGAATEVATVLLLMDGTTYNPAVRFKGSGGFTTAYLKSTDSGPVLYDGSGGSTPLSTLAPDDPAALVNYWTMIRLAPKLVSGGGIGTNEFSIVNWWHGTNNIFFDGFKGTNALVVNLVVTNGSGAFVALTVTNLQGLGGNLSGMTFSGLSGTGLQSSNSLRLGTNDIHGDLSLGSVAVATVTAGHNTLDIGTNSYVRVTGSPGTDWTLDHIKSGQRDGLLCVLDFQTGFNVIVANESSAVTTANPERRIRTLNGGDTISSGDALALLIWDPGQNRWKFGWINRGSGTSSGTQATNAIGNFNGSGTNTTIIAQDSNHVALTVQGQINQRSNLLQMTDVNSNVLSAFGPSGGLHVGSGIAAGASNLVVDGMADLHAIKSLNAGPLHRVTAAMAAGKTITVIGTLDSLISSGDTFGDNLMQLFSENYGYRGGGGSLFDMNFSLYNLNGKVTPVRSGGVALVLDLNRWWGNHVLLTQTGDQYQIGGYSPISGFGTVPIMANVFEATFAVSNGYGGFSLLTNGVPLTTIVCNTNAGILETNIVFRFTNTTAMAVTLTANLLSNFPVRIMSLGLYDYTQAGVIWINQGLGGALLSQFNAVPTVARDAAWRAWNPDVVVLKTLNGGSVSISNNLAAFWGFVTSNCPNANGAFSGMHPVEVNDADVLAENVALKQFALSHDNIAYWPAHEEFGDSFSIGKNLGYLKSGDVHLTPQGSEFGARGFWDFLNFLNQRGLRPPANFSRMPFRINTSGEIRFSGGNTNSDTNAFGVFSGNVPLAMIATNGNIYAQNENILAQLNVGGAVRLTNVSSGIVKSTSGLLSAATLGTDYLDPSYLSDTAFAASWNGVTTIGASKNAIYDRLHLFDSDDDGKVDVLDQVAGIANTDSGGVIQAPITTSAGLAAVLTDETGSGPNVFANGPVLGSASITTNLTIAKDLSAGSLTVTGMVRRVPLLVASTTLTNQIDFSLQSSYKWTNMVTNIVLQLTNLLEGAEINYYFTGGTNTGPNYTVGFTVPNPSAVAIHWGDGLTNGPTSFTVTNNARVAAVTRVWYETTTTNVEAYFRYLPK